MESFHDKLSKQLLFLASKSTTHYSPHCALVADHFQYSWKLHLCLNSYISKNLIMLDFWRILLIILSMLYALFTASKSW